MNVLVILEDTPRDRFIAVPVIRAICQQLDRPAKVVALEERLKSVEQATDLDNLLPLIAARRGMVELFILIVDRDCRAPNRLRGGDRQAALRALEQKVCESGELGNRHFIACEAIEELEVWLLAGFDHPAWNPIREECDPKETFFEPFSKQRGVFDLPAEGRANLMSEAIRRYKRIRQLCPELVDLEQRIAAV